MNKNWWHGLIGAFVGGAASAVESALVLPALAPESFDYHTHLKRLVIGVLVMACLTGWKTAAAYLKNSPTPWSGEDRRGQAAAAASASGTP